MTRRGRGILGWLFGAPDTPPASRLTAEQAVILAAESPTVRALKSDLSKAVLRRDGDRLLWRVSTNHIGAQWWVEVEDATGAVGEVHYAHGR
jgi:hypothetical protein